MRRRLAIHILALDIATKTGYAHSSGASGVQDFKPRRGDSPGMRFLEFRSWLHRIYDMAPFDLLVYEQAGRHRSGAATHIAHGMIAAAEAFAAEKKIEITNRAPPSIKAFVLPHVKIKKRDKPRMKQAVENLWPNIVLLSDDHADAILLLWFVMHELAITDTEWHRTVAV